MDLLMTKTVVALLFLILRALFGVLPLILRKSLKNWENCGETNEIRFNRSKKVEKSVILCQSTGSGIFLAACFLHIIKHLRFSIKMMMKDVVGCWSHGIKSSFPISQLALCIGFFTVYFLEEFSHWLIDKKSCKSCQNKIFRFFKFDNEKQNSKSSLGEKKDERKFILNNRKVRPDQNQAALDQMELGPPSWSKFHHKDKVQKICTCNAELSEICHKEEEKIKNRQQLMHWILTVTALSIHALLEGLSIGLKENLMEMWFLFLSAAFHATSFCFCLGLELVLANIKDHLILLQMSMLATVNPIGLFMGIYVSFIPKNMPIYATQVILEGFSAGTILYVLFFHVLSREKNRRIMGVPRALCMIVGFCSIAVMEYGDTTFKAHL